MLLPINYTDLLVSLKKALLVIPITNNWLTMFFVLVSISFVTGSGIWSFDDAG